MERSDYWDEAVSAALEDAGVVVSAAQHAVIADAIRISHEHHRLAFPVPPGTAGARIAELEQQLQQERSKVTCEACRGTGRTHVAERAQRRLRVRPRARERAAPAAALDPRPRPRRRGHHAGRNAGARQPAGLFRRGPPQRLPGRPDARHLRPDTRTGRRNAPVGSKPIIFDYIMERNSHRFSHNF